MGATLGLTPEEGAGAPGLAEAVKAAQEAGINLAHKAQSPFAASRIQRTKPLLEGHEGGTLERKVSLTRAHDWFQPSCESIPGGCRRMDEASGQGGSGSIETPKLI